MKKQIKYGVMASHHKHTKGEWVDDVFSDDLEMSKDQAIIYAKSIREIHGPRGWEYTPVNITIEAISTKHK